MIKGERRLAIPNPHRHEIGIALLTRILGQPKIDRNAWLQDKFGGGGGCNSVRWQFIFRGAETVQICRKTKRCRLLFPRCNLFDCLQHRLSGLRPSV